MNRIFYLVLLCMITHWGFAQNVFPSTGDVGIGTNTPEFPLHVLVPDNTNGIILGNDSGARFFMKVNEIGGGQLFVRSYDGHDRIFLNADGQSFFINRVGIGLNPVSNPNNYMLAVNGVIGAKEMMIENTSSTWPDYVFDDGYRLMPIKELADFINQNKHLPNIPSAKDIEDQGGHQVGETARLLLEKVEELTLYLIEQNERIVELEGKVEAISKENVQLKKKLQK